MARNLEGGDCMKALMIAVPCTAALLTAGAAHAWAGYNHVDHEVCVKISWSDPFKTCQYKISPHDKLNGEHGAGLNRVKMIWKVGGNALCRGNPSSFDIRAAMPASTTR